MRRVLAPAAFVLALCLSSSASAGPWVQSRDGYFATMRGSYLSTSTYYDSEGNEADASATLNYKARKFQFDTEYGISNKLTFLVGMPVQFLSAQFTSGNPSSFNNNGFGDLNFGLKYGFLDPAGNAAVALEIDANTPTGYNANGMGIPPMGRGEYSTIGRLHAGTTFDPTPVYVQGEVGYRKFSDDTQSNAVLYAAEAGFFPTARFLIVAEYLAQKSSDTDKQFQDLTQAGANVQYRLKQHLDVLAGVRTSLDGKNANKGTEVRLGVSLKGNNLGRYRGQTSAGYTEGTFPGAPASKSVAPAPVPVPEPVTTPTPAPSDSSSAPAQPK